METPVKAQTKAAAQTQTRSKAERSRSWAAALHTGSHCGPANQNGPTEGFKYRNKGTKTVRLRSPNVYALCFICFSARAKIEEVNKESSVVAVRNIMGWMCWTLSPNNRSREEKQQQGSKLTECQCNHTTQQHRLTPIHQVFLLHLKVSSL